MFVAGRWGELNTMSLPEGQFEPQNQFQLPFVGVTSEGGTLGMACHPNFDLNGYLYVYYTNALPEIPDQFDSIAIVRFTCPSPSRRIVDPASRTVIFHEPNAGSIHIGGWIDFGADGLLYAAIGERGSSSLAQDVASVRGKVIRINVDADDYPEDPIRNYAIPAQNPFAAGGGRPEIFLWGLRNPFRCGFDPMRRLLYVGDVGSALREELSAVPIDGPGRNLGWVCFEGTQQRSTTGVCAAVTDILFPFVEYRPTNLPPLFRFGQAIVTAGAYTGCDVPSLRHRVLFTDYYWTDEFYSAAYQNDQATEIERHVLPGLGRYFSGFARDGLGEIYILSSTGIHKIIPATPQSADFNTDGAVNTPDLIFLLARFGQPATPGALAAPADFNNDGSINTPDLTYFLARFGTTCP